MDDVSLRSAGRLPDDSSRYCKRSGADDCFSSLCQQYRGVGRAQTTSTGYCRDQDVALLIRIREFSVISCNMLTFDALRVGPATYLSQFSA